MSKELLMVVDAVSNEKGVSRDVIFEALEAALASATRKRHDEDIEVRVSVDRTSGEYETFRRWAVLPDDEEIENPDAELHLDEARERDAQVEVGGHVEEPMESIAFGRIAAQTAKQVIFQKVREAERKQVAELYENRVGELVNGVVKRVERGNIYIDLGGNAEALIPREESIPRESVRTGDRLRGYLKEVREDVRGPQLIVSRTAPELIIELFKLEVPEVGQGLVEILGAAREPGVRAKIAVRSMDRRVDPVGACVGMRGARVQAVSRELNEERVDIITWDENPAQFVINAMAPAEVLSIVVDEERSSMDIAVAEEFLSKAIGRGGQNVRLASQLTGWELNIMSTDEAEQKSEAEAQRLTDMFKTKLNVDEEVANILVQEGFASLDEVAYVPASELARIEEFDEDVIEELRNRARDVLLAQAIASEEVAETSGFNKDILDVAGMTGELAVKLANEGIANREALAELATDELTELTGMGDEEAAAMIMSAREIWFADEAESTGSDAAEAAEAK
ncbi:MAG TPA: transcription termination factor NusA [Gammaproteobacteria bacterium]|nr:transcription termination factor NusA [Gammaproteobacteria bacterium]